MKYAIDYYVKAGRKYNKINSIIKEIEELISKRNEMLNNIIDVFINKITINLSAKKKLINGLKWNELPLFICKNGFYHSLIYRKRLNRIEPDIEFLNFLSKNKDIIIEYVSNKNSKKKILYNFLIKWDKYKINNYEMGMGIDINREISILDYEEGVKRVFITDVFCKICFDKEIRITMNYKHINNNNEIENDNDYMNITDSVNDNFIKEQLYLPLCKLLIKYKRNVNKQLRKTKKLLNELEPYFVAEKI